MLAVFKKSIANSPNSLLQNPNTEIISALKDGFLATHFSSVHADSIVVNLASNGLMAYSSTEREFAVVDNIFCLFQGNLENFDDLRASYGLKEETSEAIIAIEAYWTLEDECPYNYSSRKVIRDIKGKFAFILYDNDLKTTFVASDADGRVPLFWGTDGDGDLVISTDEEIVKKGCGNFCLPFPKGCVFSSFGGLWSYLYPRSEIHSSDSLRNFVYPRSEIHVPRDNKDNSSG